MFGHLSSTIKCWPFILALLFVVAAHRLVVRCKLRQHASKLAIAVFVMSGVVSDLVGLWKVVGFVDPTTGGRLSSGNTDPSLLDGVLKRNETLRLSPLVTSSSAGFTPVSSSMSPRSTEQVRRVMAIGAEALRESTQKLKSAKRQLELERASQVSVVQQDHRPPPPPKYRAFFTKEHHSRGGERCNTLTHFLVCPKTLTTRCGSYWPSTTNTI